MTDHRRRVDIVLDPSFVEALDDATPQELRARLRDAKTEEDSISYVRRNLHGHLDLLRAELDVRLGGRGTTRSVATLTAVLGADSPGGNGRGGRASLGLRAAAVAGHRGVERVLLEDHLARLPEMSDEEIADVVDRVSEAERRLSDDRLRLHAVIDALEAELGARYKHGLQPSLERLQ
jgi:hypothetical protein